MLHTTETGIRPGTDSATDASAMRTPSATSAEPTCRGDAPTASSPATTTATELA